MAQQHDPNQLFVLLEPGERGPRPEAVVEASRHGEALPAGLGVGNPTKVDLLIPRRARGAEAEANRLDPERPAAKLQRYLVLTYPETVDLDAVAEALGRNPRVEWTGAVRHGRISLVEPNDPRFNDDPGGVPRPPDQYQWGSYSLGLPAAWEYAKGHAYVGVLDTGIDSDHEDLRAFDASGNYVGGNFRSHLSWDYENNNAVVDDGAVINGHGTHVSGIVGATANNGLGVAGACWNCAVVMSQVTNTGSISDPALIAGIEGSLDRGMQVLNMSFGFRPSSNPPDCATQPNDPVCVALQEAEDRQVLIAAAAGNDGSSQADWPSTDPRVLGAGGIASDGSFWNDCPGFECGSNSDPDQFDTPAKQIFSTFYFGLSYNPSIGCSDEVDGVVDGYGPCTGTSMASPYLAASAGILRSVNPLLPPAEIEAILADNLENPPGWDPADGIGKPNVAEAVKDALGRVGGTVIDNRLTPLFQLKSDVAGDYAYTTVPQYASALTWAPESYYSPLDAPLVSAYTQFFPGGRTCQVAPCLYQPRASVFVFATDRSPDGHPLVPLYRLSFDAPFGGNADDRDHNYTTEAAGIESFAGVGYRLDGVEGYIYARCTPEPSCIPAGAVRLYRYYNSSIDDWAIFPESELSTWQSRGYGPSPGANEWIGYVYENVDSDFDGLIDGFENLIGTDPGTADSDCDGATDGAELFRDYPYSDPLVGSCSGIVGETGQVTNLTQVSRTVLLQRSYTNPVVIAQPASYNGPDTAVVRITSVQPDRFTFHIAEAPDRDGGHTTETVSYLVLEAGSWRLPDGTEIEAGKVSSAATVGTNVANTWQAVSFSKAFASTPLVLSQVQTANDPSWVKTRQLDPTTTGVQIAMEEEEAATTAHATESIGWLALSPATGVWSGHRFQAGTTGNSVTDAFFSFGFGQSLASAPRFLAALASYHGGNNAGVRYQGLTATGSSVKVEEDTTFDAEVAHIAEVVSFLALQGDGTLAAAPR